MKQYIAPALVAAAVAVAALVPKHISAQSNPQDVKSIAATSGVVDWCSYPPPYLVDPTIVEQMQMALYPNQHGKSDHCTITWKLLRDHMAGQPTSVIMNVTQNGSGTWQNYGSISCALLMEERGTTTNPGDGPIEVEGAWTVLSYSASRPAGTQLTFNLPMPALIPLSTGHTPHWDGSPLSVRCDFGNDFIINDVTWTENGTD